VIKTAKSENSLGKFCPKNIKEGGLKRIDKILPQPLIKNVTKKLKRWNQRKNLDNFQLESCWREVLWPIIFMGFKELKI